MLAIAQIFIVIGLGWLLANHGKRVIGSAGSDFWGTLARLIYWVSVPAMVIDMLAKFTWSTEHRWFVGGCVVLALVTLFTTILLGTWLPFSRVQKLTAIGIASAPNCVFLGFPLIQTAVGQEGMPFAVLFGVIAFPMITVAAVIILIRLDDHEDKHLARQIVDRTLRDPVVLGSFVGIALSLSSINLPEWIGVPIKWLGSIASPVALLTIGARLSLNGSCAMQGALVFIGLVKLCVAPLLAFAVARMMDITGTAQTVFVLLAATPVAATAQLLVEQHKGDRGLTANAIAATTLASLFTLSVITMMMS